MSDPILVKPILGLRPPPFLQVIQEKLYLRAFYVLKTTFSKKTYLLDGYICPRSNRNKWTELNLFCVHNNQTPFFH